MPRPAVWILPQVAQLQGLEQSLLSLLLQVMAVLLQPPKRQRSGGAASLSNTPAVLKLKFAARAAAAATVPVQVA